MRSGGVHRDLTRTLRWYHAALRFAFYPVCALVLGCACAKGAPRAPVAPDPAAATPAAPAATAAPATSTEAVAPWLARSQQWPVVSEPLPSGHLGRAHRAEIRVNPEARAAYLALVADTQFADGTWLIESLKDTRTGMTGPTFALERRAGSWVYWELDAIGRVQAEGALPLCAGCHAGASARPVFGLPRTPPPQESNDARARSPN